MNAMYIFCLVFGATMSIIQIFMGAMGLDHQAVTGDHTSGLEHGHIDGHAGHTGHSGHNHSDPQQSLNLLTVRAISGGMTFFGLTGGFTLAASHNMIASIIVALVFGYLGAYATALAISKLTSFDTDGTMQLANAVGSTGTAYTSMAPGETGMALVKVQGRTMKMSVINRNGTCLNSGDPLKVLEMRGDIAVVVSPTATVLFG